MPTDIVCDTEHKARAVTFNPHLKLLMTLAKLNAKQIDVEADERMYYIHHLPIFLFSSDFCLTQRAFIGPCQKR
jgi:hypothetical protein